MNPRFVLWAAAVLTGGVAVALTVLPTSTLGSLLDVEGESAATFLVRRYAVSATAALCVAIVGIGRATGPERAALLSVSTWFAGQGIVALFGLATGEVGGLAWLAVVADPSLAVVFLRASRGAGPRSSRRLPAGRLSGEPGPGARTGPRRR